MAKVIKITESELNKIVDRVIKEQEDQYMSDVDQEQMSGDAVNSDEPDFSEFIECSMSLLSQGVTIGELVDKICENKPEPEN